MTATGLGQTLQDHRQLLRQVAGVVIGLMGVLFIGTLFLPLLNKEWRPESLLARAHTGGPIVAGLAFAVAWLPCTGPTLGAILTAAGTKSTVGEGGVLLAFYALGLAVPFILSALAFSRFSRVFRFFRNHYSGDHGDLRRGPRGDGSAAVHQRAEPAELAGAVADGRPRNQLLQRPVRRALVGALVATFALGAVAHAAPPRRSFVLPEAVVGRPALLGNSLFYVVRTRRRGGGQAAGPHDARRPRRCTHAAERVGAIGRAGARGRRAGCTRCARHQPPRRLRFEGGGARPAGPSPAHRGKRLAQERETQELRHRSQPRGREPGRRARDRQGAPGLRPASGGAARPAPLRGGPGDGAAPLQRALERREPAVAARGQPPARGQRARRPHHRPNDARSAAGPTRSPLPDRLGRPRRGWQRRGRRAQLSRPVHTRDRAPLPRARPLRRPGHPGATTLLRQPAGGADGVARQAGAARLRRPSGSASSGVQHPPPQPRPRDPAQLRRRHRGSDRLPARAARRSSRSSRWPPSRRVGATSPPAPPPRAGRARGPARAWSGC